MLLGESKIGFYGKLNTDFLDEPVDGKWFRTTKDFSFFRKGGEEIVVPAGTYTDFASIPRGFRWLISRVGRHGRAAVLHDYLCESGIVKRKLADEIFMEGMESLNVKKWRRKTMFFGVRTYSKIFKRGR